MNSELLIDVMKHFIPYSAASKENPALLILDNHESHLSIEAIDLAKASGVTMLTLHPHTTAKMQPLDVGLNAPFKSYNNAAVDAWLVRNPAKQLTIYNVAECVGSAYMRAMTPINITNAFKKCGIFPFDDKIFTDEDFLPSEVTNRPTPDVEDSEDEIDVVEEDIVGQHHGTPNGSLSILNTNENQKLEDIPLPPAASFEEHINSVTENIAPQPSSSVVSEVYKTTDSFVSPKIFRPPLKAGPRKMSNRKAGKSMVATDTPEKNALSEKRKQNKNRQKIPKRTKVVKMDLFNNNKRKRVKSDSSDDEEEEFKCSGSSSGGKIFLSGSEEEEIILDDDFPSLRRNPHPKDYVTVAFTSKKTKVYYLAEVLEQLEEEHCEYFVSYLKLKSKAKQLFTLPLEPDTAGVNQKDIKYILPRPKMSGSTSRQQAIYKFPIDMSQLNLRY